MMLLPSTPEEERLIPEADFTHLPFACCDLDRAIAAAWR